LARFRHEHHEFIAALTAEQVALADHIAKPIRHYLQHLVAHVVAELVVYRLEAVEIELEQRDTAAMALG
jgi:hypothetical protein